MSMVKRVSLLAIVLTLIGSGLTLFMSIRPAAPKTPPVLRPALTVTVVKPARWDMPMTLVANGSVAAWQEAVIGAEIGGLRLAEVRVQVGDSVKKGQLLAAFAQDSVQAEVAQSRAALLEAEANLDEARHNAERARKIARSALMTAQQVAQYLTGEKTAEARLQSAKALLDTQLLRLRYTRVVAPDDGVISSRSATQGAVAMPGQELFRLIRQNRLEWRGEVSTAELGQLKAGFKVTVQVPGFAKVTGSIRKIGPTVDAQSRNALVYVDLPGAAQYGLRPGMFAHGEFHLGQRSGLTVNQDTLSLRDGFSYVFRLNEQSGDRAKVSQVKVQTGRRVNDQVEILTGIANGDRLVGSGASFLADGDNVKVLTP